MFRLPRRWLAPCLSLVTATALGLSAYAQLPSDLIKEAKQRQEIATQQAEAELRAAIRKADASGKTEALALLKQTLDRVEGNDEIHPDRKTAMVRMLKDRLRLADLSTKAGGSSMADAAISAKSAARRADADKQATEREKIRAAITEINKLDGQGRKDEAARQANELYKQFPDNPAAKVMARGSNVRLAAREAKDLLAEQERGQMAWMSDLKRGSMMPTGDVEFDKKRWAEIGKLRKGDKLTEKEKALLTALNEPVRADWRNAKFADVIDALATASKQTIVIDKKALEDQSVNYEETVVNFVAPKTISMRSALRKVLQDLGLTYIVKDELIYVTTAAKARELMVTRVYPIGDLVTGQGFFGNPLNVGPAIAAQNDRELAKMIVDMVKDAVDPNSWQGNGGQGTITYSPINKSLIVRQSSEIQLMLKGSLGGGK